MELKLPRGMRDFPPDEKILRDDIISTLITVFRRYGFNPLETPVIERLDVLTAKYGASDETDVSKEIYCFKDQGGRDLGLRFDLTVPASRFVGMNPQLKMPFKRYQVGDVFRDGPVKLGRYREFTQCDVDIFGCPGLEADSEIIRLALDSFKALGISVRLSVNNRKLLNEIILFSGADKILSESIMITLDKMNKIGVDGVRKELESKGVNDNIIRRLLELISVRGSNKEKITKIRSFLGSSEGLDELEELISYLDDSAILFDPSLARGLAYYTGTVFEGVILDSKVTSSVCGGGRYNNLIGVLGGKEIPAVGISFGLEPITEHFKATKGSIKKSLTELFVIPIKCFRESQPIIQELRDLGINVEVDIMGRSVRKNLEYANHIGVPFVIFIGAEELSLGKVKLRDMGSGEEAIIGIKEASEKVISSRKWPSKSI